MPVSVQNNGVSNQPITSPAEFNQLGQEEFLKILIAQLRFQDPLNPMDDRDFIAQMAQFSSLEQMIKLNTTMETLLFSQVMDSLAVQSHLIGKQVTWSVSGDDSTASEQGIVVSVLYKNGEIHLQMEDGQQIPAYYVYKVEAATDHDDED